MPLPLTVSCFSKSRLVLPFWYRLNRVVLDKGPLNVCVCVWVECHCSMKYHTQWSNKSNKSVFRLFRHLWMWHCPHLLLSTGACCTAPATCPLLSTYISCPQDVPPLHRPCSAYNAGIINNIERYTKCVQVHFPNLSAILEPTCRQAIASSYPVWNIQSFIQHTKPL